MEQLPAISIIIPTLNRYEDLNNTLQDLQRQERQDFEILIIDQSAKPEEVIWPDQRLRYFRMDIPSASAARNLGIREARAEILLFMDDDVIISDPRFLDNHLRHYIDADIPGVAGCALEMGQEARYHRHWMSRRKNLGWLYFPSNFGAMCRVHGGRSNNLSVRRELAIAVGGMDEQYVKGAHREESDFCLRVSRRFGMFLFDPYARLIHIGNRKGGIRSWSQEQKVKAQHHFDGNMYFMFNMLPLRQWPEYLLLSLHYFALNRAILRRPADFFRALGCFGRALRNGYRQYQQGRKHLSPELSKNPHVV